MAVGGCPDRGFEREFDPTNPALIANPHPHFAQARREEPVFYSPSLNAWVITRYDDVMAVLRNTRQFGKRQVRPLATLTPAAEKILIGYRKVPVFDTNPPEHDRIRHHVSRAFAPSRIAGLAPVARRLADDLIDQFQQDGETEIISRFCFPLPALLIFEVLGVPAADLDDIRHLSRSLVDLFFDLPSPDRQVGLAEDVVAYWAYCEALVEDRRSSPGVDLLSDLLALSDDDHHPLSTEEVVSIAITLVVAGHRTTTNLLGNSLKHLLGHPDRWPLVVADEEHAKAAIEETLRYDASTNGVFYTALDEVKAGPVTLAAGSRVYLVFTSANHDDSHFDSPELWDTSRPNLTKHLAFGFGEHWCVGAPLARMTGRIALGRLAARLPGLRLLPQEIVYAPLFASRAPERLLVAWQPPASSIADGSIARSADPHR